MNKETKKSFGVHELLISIFYIIIIAVGINLCLERGQNATVLHLAAVSVCIVGALAIKIHKLGGKLKGHISELAFPLALAVISIFAVIAHIFG